MVFNAFYTFSCQRVTSRTGSTARLTLMDCVVVELKGEAFENNMIFRVIGGDAGKEDSTIDCIIDIV